MDMEQGDDKRHAQNRTAVINSHKQKMMQRSASAPSVQQNADFDDPQKKRNRTTPDQLQILEDVFARNPTPNSQLRDAIAHKVGMSPRSVQVWFQNRRAKEKKSSHRDMDPSKAQMPLFMNPYQMVGNPHMMHPSFVPGPRMGMPPTSILGAEAAAFGFSTIQHPMGAMNRPQVPMTQLAAQMPSVCLPLDRLKIGTWTRLAMSDSDLMCGIDINTTQLSWVVVEGPYRCKIEFPFSSILSIEAHIVDEGFTFLTIQIDMLPKFFLEVRVSPERSIWKPCNDITEAKQASTNLKHNVQMSTSVFRDEMLGIIRNNIVLHKALNLIDDTTSPNPAMVLNQREFVEQKPKYLQSEDEKSMKKSISVPTLPYNINHRFSEPINEVDYSSFVQEQPEEVATPWSRQSEIGSYSHIDLDSLGLPSLGSSNSFSSIGSSTLAASLEEANLDGV